MAEADRYWFTHQEVATALIKQQGIREGIWALSVEFGLVAVNAGQNDDSLAPTALIPVKRIGLVKVEERSSLSVDASEVNPRLKTTRSKRPDSRVI
jgi:hypothetical protein